MLTYSRLFNDLAVVCSCAVWWILYSDKRKQIQQFSRADSILITLLFNICENHHNSKEPFLGSLFLCSAIDCPGSVRPVL